MPRQRGSSTSNYRVWWKDEFDECKDQDALDELAWKVPDDRGIFDPERRIPCDDPEDAAKKYADYFYSERDGGYDKWPIEFVVHDGQTYVVISIDLDYEPVFTSADPVPCAPAFAPPADVAEETDATRSAGG